MRSGSDHLVSGSSLIPGNIPVNVVITDDPTGLGKLITLNSGGTTPSDTYRIVITAREEVLTDVQDQFLKNANLSESTGQKLRINYRIDIVPESGIDSSPTPYTNDANDKNLVNEVIVTPSGGSGDLAAAVQNIPGSEQIDGRDIEIIINNPAGVNPLPNAVADQAAFYNGQLIDSNGNEFHINAMFNDTVSTKVVLRIDKEDDQIDPVITLGTPYRVIKKPIFATDDAGGNPLGKLFFPIATVVWDSSTQLAHGSSITDLRTSISSRKDFTKTTNLKYNLTATEGGSVSWDATAETLTWSTDVTIINPHGINQTISSDTYAMVDGGSLVFELDLNAGSPPAIERGPLAATVGTAGATSTLTGSPDLSSVRLGNVIVDSGGVVAEITAIDDVNDTITTTPALSNTGAATIHRDSFGPGTAPLSDKAYAFAVRSGSRVWVAGGLELEDGETQELGDQFSSQLLTYIGAADESDSTPAYSSDIRGTASESLTARSGVLTDAMGDQQEDRSGYLRSDNTITWSGTQLEFTADLVLELINTKSGTLTAHSIALAGSPVAVADGESLYVAIDRTAASEIVTLVNSGATPIPAQTQTDKDIFVLFRRVDVSGTAYLHIPFHKQVLETGQSVRLGASGGGGTGLTKVDFLDPISTVLPTGTSVVIDGVTGLDGDLVLYTNLSSGNNRVYELSGVGASLVWTAVRAFDNQFDPTDGDVVIVRQGDAFKEQISIFDGINWKVNDVVRLFDGVSANFWEFSSIKSATLNNNDTGTIINTNVTGSENIIASYSVVRGSAKETGEIVITSDGTNASLARTNTSIGDIGTEFNATVEFVEADENFRAVYNSNSLNADESLDSAVPTISGSPVISSDKLSLASINDQVKYGFSSTDPLNIGTVRLKVTPTSVATSSIFKIGTTGNSNRIQLQIGAGADLVVSIFDSAGSILALLSPGSVDLTIGIETEIEISWDAGAGDYRVFTDGILLDSIITGPTGTRTAAPDFFLGKDPTPIDGFLGSVDDIQIFNTVKHTANFAFEIPRVVSTLGLNLTYTTDASGSAGTMKYFVKRWSNAVLGGPTGIPNYSAITGLSTVPAAGNIGEIQFHGSSGNLDADPKLAWDSTEDALDLNGLKRSALSGAIVLNDNQAAPLSVINYLGASYKSAVVEYSVERDGDFRTGRILVANDATTNVGFSDDFVDTASVGITFSASITAGTLNIEYTSTSTGFAGTLKYSIKKW